MNPLLSLKGLGKTFGGNHAVRDLSFDLRPGERVALIGPNGAGKSTCFNLIGGQIVPDRGTVLLKDRPLQGLRPDQRHALGLGRTFQIGSVFRSMTLEENLATALAAVPHDDEIQKKEEAWNLLQAVGLADLRAQQSATLAYGDIKRLELAMALAGRPSLLLMDEPTAGMAPGERHELMLLVTRLADERGITLLFTEHDMDIVFDHAERILVLDHGSLIADGIPPEVRGDPLVRRIYLGEDF